MVNKDKLLNKNNGYPKIVTNNGERVIISTRPLSSKKFVAYTNPNVQALDNCVKKLYGNKDSKRISANSKILEDDNEFDQYILKKNKDFEKNINNIKSSLYDKKIDNSKSK